MSQSSIHAVRGEVMRGHERSDIHAVEDAGEIMGGHERSDIDAVGKKRETMKREKENELVCGPARLAMESNVLGVFTGHKRSIKDG